MNNGPSDETAAARGDLAGWLDDYAAGRCDRARMQASFLEICRSNTEAPWDALALLDQYQRRGRVDAALARSLKSDIAQLVFGVVGPAEEDEESAEQAAPRTDPAPSTTDTGTRWRRMAEVQKTSTAGGRPARTFPDPVQVDREAPQPRRAQPTRRPDVAGGAAPGSVLRDRYDLLAILGRGHAGTVYKALDRHRAHLDPSAQCVALRVLNRNYPDSPGALAELERQFHLAQSLSHPNIARVFDLDRHGSTYFLVMELLEGELLSSVLDRLDTHPMPREQALAIIGGMGAGLSFIHRRGVVHADLRPGNVMITSTGEVRLLDTGFVRREQGDTRRHEPWIGEEAGGGRQPDVELAYASEERVNGEPPEAGEDVYSFACIAYELLSGRHPFGGRAAPIARTQGRSPQRIRGLARRQWTALRTALKWSRAERKIDVVKLVEALGCTGEPQRLTPPRMIIAAPERRKPVAGLAALVVVLAGVAAAAYWFYRGAWPEITIPLPASSQPREAVEVVPGPAALPQAQPSSGEPAEADAAPPQVTAVAPSTPVPTETAPVPEPVAVGPRESPVSAPARQDAPGGVSRIGFDKDTYVATESNGSVTLTVRRTGSTRRAITFQWRLLPNSAEAGNDFAAIGPGTETIPAGARTATITVPLVSDAVKESTELFLVELSDPSEGAELGELSRAAAIIVDDD